MAAGLAQDERSRGGQVDLDDREVFTF